MVQIHLRTSNGHYLCAEGGGGGAVNATRTSAGTWETFTVVNLPIAGIPIQLGASLRAYNGMYVSAEDGGGGSVNANRGAASSWETFRIEGPLVNGARIHLRTNNGHYLCAEGGGGGALNATRTAAGDWETFTVELSTLPPSTATRFTFSFDSFQLTNTRSAHTDTDFATLGIGPATAPTNVQTKAFGDLNNGTYRVGLSTGPIDCSKGAAVHYNVLNQGHTDTSAIEKALHAAVDALLQVAKNALNGQVDQRVPTTGPNSSGDVLANQGLKMVIAAGAWLLAQFANLGITAAFANCDGVCVADTLALDLPTLQKLCAGNLPYKETRPYPGSNSDSGCGSNSQYYASFTITPA